MHPDLRQRLRREARAAATISHPAVAVVYALEEMGDKALLSTTAAFLGQALLAQERDEDAERAAGLSEELAAEDDVITQAGWRGVRATVLARRGGLAEAERLARQAVALAERTDFVNHQAEAHAVLGGVLGKRGRYEGSQAALAEALKLYEQKGNLMAAMEVRADLASATRV